MLLLDHFFKAIHAVFVHEFPDHAAGALILHSGFHKIYRIDGGGAHSTGDGAQNEAVNLLDDGNQSSATFALRLRLDGLLKNARKGFGRIVG